MTNSPFTANQIFTLKRKTLEKRMMTYYEETGDEESIIKYLIALQVRDELGIADFSFFHQDLVRHIFFNTKSTRALRRYYKYFEEYFTEKEWRSLTSRLFSALTFVSKKIKTLYTQFIKEPLALLGGS
ncbi:hypothetical protein JZO77_11550 [Enterococcus hulanensis]|uniref:Uncharacterized protein n=1 Tax=Enterococcus hulanensis TaxID=2559929 RepID=A0ABU3F4X4_9ENTE|nr:MULTISPECIES: hypothetical protein [Enterococcus]MBO0410667.1 hypothetical protein [Enterococcus hulanensis]MBO0457366.1 hypothetical protein [Enterococcus hulanensis]MBX8937414.1 hypothetical protein [Enterococcus gilvus]MDT2602195.1 hypothetical protein [Enterococcus hulanensis]MDT2611590.1 hypothetical protein [Enterococcus hulanensis]